MAKPFDIIIFGASGYTGQFVVEEMAGLASKENISWAVAGRNRHKVQQTLEDARTEPSDNLKRVEIFEADVANQTSLDNMCKNAKVIINCVGPYEKYGEAVVKACLKHRTHLIDMTVEIMYIYRMILRYYHEAESREVYIVSACGIGYLPMEMAIAILQKRFGGGIRSLECYISPEAKPNSVHFGTWESMVTMCNGYYEILAAKQKVSSQILNQNQSIWSILSLSWPLKYIPEEKGYGIFFPSFLKTPQLSLDLKQDVRQEKPMKMNTYIVLKSWLTVIKVLIFVASVLFLIPFSFGKWLLLTYPELFSFGVATKSNITDKTDVIGLSMTIVAKGWRSKQDNDSNPLRNPNKVVTLRSTPQPAYKCTAMCLVQSALVVLKDTHLLPKRGGIYTPLAAFAETTLLLSRILPDGRIAYKLTEN